MEVKPGYKQSEVGVLPEEWSVKTLQEVAGCLDNLRVPLNESQRERRKGDFPYCGANGVLDFVNGYVIDDDIILMAEDGGYFDEYETRPIAYRMRGKCWVNNHAHILKAKPGFDQGFLFYSLVHKNILPFLASGTRAKLNKSEMSKIVVPAPTTEAEQHAIAEALSDVDALLDALDQLVTKKHDLKQAAMQELLTGETRLPGFHGEWETRPLSSEIADLQAGVSVNSVEDDLDAGTGALAVLKTSAVAGGAFIPSECKTIAPRDLGRVKLSPVVESVIISRMNTIDLVGECGYVPADFPDLFVPDRLWMTRFRSTSRVSAKWLAFVLSSPASRQLIRNIATGTSGSMKNISKQSFLALEFEFPCPDEQTAIAAVLTDMDAELVALEERSKKTRALKQGMMQELLTGKTRLVSPKVCHA